MRPRDPNPGRGEGVRPRTPIPRSEARCEAGPGVPGSILGAGEVSGPRHPVSGEQVRVWALASLGP